MTRKGWLLAGAAVVLLAVSPAFFVRRSPHDQTPCHLEQGGAPPPTNPVPEGVAATLTPDVKPTLVGADPGAARTQRESGATDVLLGKTPGSRLPTVATERGQAFDHGLRDRLAPARMERAASP